MSYYKYLKYKYKYYKKLNNNIHLPIHKFVKQSKLMKKSIDTITMTKTANKSFIFLNVDLTKNEKQIILSPNFGNIEEPNFNYYGTIRYDILSKQLDNYLAQFYQKNSTEISKILVDKIIKPFVVATDKDSFWCMMRFMEPSTEYDIPRWHQDGPLVPYEVEPNQNGIGIRLISTLFGPGTLFKIDNSEMKNKFLEMDNELYSKLSAPFVPGESLNIINHYRKITDEELKKYPQVQLKNGQIAIFITNPGNIATIHSEPKVNHSRLIFSVTAADKSYIQKIADMADQKFL
ncbi:MAG: hypothetical protein Satyrvirus5_32 [Satyrvirus sp.]|uniref:Uncharacterized protein n=1 Tax=Satyrvirus sp. TaxID=2487771 RepID=A0A3G5ADC6_9VIRU|nr:MAG: hypothetical protein Satyrvirus5_32 [Satyrvirus sp.]